MRDPRLEQLERILTSPGFAQSDRLSRFLRYAVEETVAERESQIKETTIGVDVFGKPAGFDPKSDSTVRSEAVKLRSRLAAYYAAPPGDGDPWIIQIPKGTYVPEFTQRPVAETSPVVPVPEVARSRIGPLWQVAVVVLAAVGGYLIWNAIQHRPRVAPASQPARLTWDRGLNTDPALSAEGKLLVYASTRSGEGNLDIWIRSVQSGSGTAEPLRLTSHPANDSEPDISPHGDLVVFRSQRDGGGIYSISALGGGGERLLLPGGRRPRFSPGDGRRIAYYTGEPRLFQSAIASGRIFVADAAVSEPPRQLARGFAAAVAPVWSPDGKSILFLGYPDKDFATHKMDWWLTPADGSGVPVKAGFNEAVEKHHTCGAKARPPHAWTGDSVLFQTDCSGTTGIARIELRGGKIRGRAEPVTVGSGGESAPAATPSGLIAYVANSQQTSIWSASLANKGGTPVRLTESEAKEQYPSISDDGKLLAYVSLRSGNSDVWLRDLASGQERLVAGGPGHQTYSEIEPDGKHITYTTLEPDPKDPVGFNSVAWRKPVPDGVPAKICEHCAYYGRFGAAAANRIFDLDGRPTVISVHDAGKLEWPPFIAHPKSDVLKPTVHPSRNWVAFNVKHDDVARIHIAPLVESVVQPIPVTAWVELAEGYMPVWSRDGRILYFASNRDGNDCIWALPFDPSKGKAAGPATPLIHFHNPEERLEPGVDVYRWMAVSRTQIVYPVSRVASSIWILK